MSVRQVLAEIDSRELTEWAAYELVEPFGPWREDLRSGIVASTIANTMRGKGARPFTPDDFMPEFGGQQQEVMSSEETIAAFAAAFGARK